jgi:hypothetical protein
MANRQAVKIPMTAQSSNAALFFARGDSVFNRGNFVARNLRSSNSKTNVQ